jgi:hypothetical protein
MSRRLLPDGVTAGVFNDTAGWVRWSPPPPQHHNGLIIGYKIQIKGTIVRSLTMNASTTSVLISNLTTGGSYNARIAALTHSRTRSLFQSGASVDGSQSPEPANPRTFRPSGPADLVRRPPGPLDPRHLGHRRRPGLPEEAPVAEQTAGTSERAGGERDPTQRQRHSLDRPRLAADRLRQRLFHSARPSPRTTPKWTPAACPPSTTAKSPRRTRLRTLPRCCCRLRTGPNSSLRLRTTRRRNAPARTPRCRRPRRQQLR